MHYHYGKERCMDKRSRRFSFMRSFFILSVSVLALYSPPLSGDESKHVTVAIPGKPLAWIGLYNSEMVDWLEKKTNPPRDEKKPDPHALPWRQFSVDSYKYDSQCILLLPVFKAPSANSERMGYILLAPQPPKGLWAYFIPEATGIAMSFLPDLYDVDWGYGPWFHQTILEKSGNWIKLPKKPFPEPVWLDSSKLAQKPDVKEVMLGEIYLLGDESILILDFDDTGIIVRPEQEADFCCCTDPPAIQPFTSRHIPYTDLFDKDGHLKLDYKYKRAC